MLRKGKKGACVISSIDVCCFCQKPLDEKLGNFFTSLEHSFAVHQYCLFFSSGLPQNGSDDEGFEGYLEKDILKEIRRARRLRCNICRLPGASAGCCMENCRKVCHFPCGQAKNYLFQYFGEFSTYCSDHRLYQNDSNHAYHKPKLATCSICLEDVPCSASPDTLTTPCCKDVWFHRSCVQEQAKISGYFFRCAVCNDADNFVKEMKQMGIYVPDRDAAWEDGQNFAELLEKYSICDSSACKCPFGKMFSADGGLWELVLCSACGQYGTHVGCKTWSTSPPLLFCPTCRPIHLKSDDTGEAACSPRKLSRLHRIQLVSKATVNPDVDVTSDETHSRTTRGRRKRVREESDDEDISLVLNGLKRQASNDFRGLGLTLETKLVVQRTLAVGTAAIENSGRKVESTARDSRSSENKTRQESVTIKGSSENCTTEDDDCVITKYISCPRICSKCNLRKPWKGLSRSRASESPKRPLSASTACGGTSCTASSTRTNTGRQSQANPVVNSRRPPFMEYTESVSTRNSEKGFEVTERVTNNINKSCVAVVSAAKEDNKSPIKAKPVGISEQETMLQKESSKADISLDESVESVISETMAPQGSKTSSFWSSSVENLFQFFNRRSSETTQEETEGTRESLETVESEVVRDRSKAAREKSKATREVPDTAPKKAKAAREKSDTEMSNVSDAASTDDAWKRPQASQRKLGVADNAFDQFGVVGLQPDFKMSLSRLRDVPTTSAEMAHDFSDRDCKAVDSGEFPFPTAGMKTRIELSVSGRQPDALGCVNTSSREAKPREPNESKPCTFFSRSDPERTVIEAALDQACMQLRSSGKELTHRCLKSF